MTQLEIFLPSGWLKPGRNQTLHSLTREWSSHFPEHSLDSGQLVSCLCRDVFPPSNLWKKWIFFHFLFDSIFFFFLNTRRHLVTINHLGCGVGRKEAAFVSNRMVFIWEIQNTSVTPSFLIPWESHKPKRIVWNPFPGLCLFVCGVRAPSFSNLGQKSSVPLGNPCYGFPSCQVLWAPPFT